MKVIVSKLNKFDEITTVSDEFVIRIFTMLTERNTTKSLETLMENTESSFLKDFFPFQLCDEMIKFSKDFIYYECKYLEKEVNDHIVNLDKHIIDDNTKKEIIDIIFKLFGDSYSIEYKRNFIMNFIRLQIKSGLDNTQDKLLSEIIGKVDKIIDLDFNHQFFTSLSTRLGSHEENINLNCVTDMQYVYFVFRKTMYRVQASSLTMS